MLDFLRRMKDQIIRDRLSLVAAGVAFYGLLALFPALVALVALYGLAFDAEEVTQQIAALEGLLPRQGLELVVSELKNLVSSSRGVLGWGAAGALALALWSAARGIKTLMEALNVAYGLREDRGFLRRNALALALTLAAIVGAGLAIAVIVLIPIMVRFLGLGPLLEEAVTWARWPVIALAVGAGIAVMYRYGPSRKRRDWRVVGRGALIATGLWLAGSAAFSLYVSSFGTFNQTYGSVAAIVVLLLWFLVSAYAVLLGAEINAELERRSGPADCRNQGERRNDHGTESRTG